MRTPRRAGFFTRAGFIFIVIAPIAAPVVAGTYTASYLGGGVWEQDGNWSTTAYPNNGHFVTINGNPYPDGNPLYNAVIDIASPCTLGTSVVIQGGSVAHGSTLNIANNGRVSANGAFINSGLITLNSGSGGAHFRPGNNSGVSSSGLIEMGDSATNYLSASNDGFTFTIATGGIVRGAGQLNLGSFGGTEHAFNFVNHGLIEATKTGNQLDIGLYNEAGANLTNDGTLRASGSGALRFHIFGGSGSTVFNSGGTLQATDNGNIRIGANVTVQGGTIATSGNGAIRGDNPGNSGGTLQDVTNTGTVAIASNEALYLKGTFTNNGVLRMESTPGNNADLRTFGTNTTLGGNGTLLMSNSGNNYISATADGNTLTVGSNATIRGSGQLNIGFFGGTAHFLNFVNHGTIDAVGTSALQIKLSNTAGSNLTNTGVLRSSSGSALYLLSFDPSTVFNTSGTITALDGGTVRIGAGTTVEGGLITTTGTGAIRGNTAANSGGGTLSNLTSTGTVGIAKGEQISIAGTFTNNGTVALNALDGDANLLFAANTTVNGGGSIALGKEFGNAIGGNGTTGLKLTLAPGATIRGGGHIGELNNNFQPRILNVVNQGLIESTAGMSIYVNSSLGSDVTNTGILRSTASGGYLQFSGPGTVRNNDGGRIEVLAGSKVQFDGVSLTNNGGTIDLKDGSIDCTLGLDLESGQLIGNGTFTGPVRNTGGVVGPGHSPGKLTINGDYTQGTNGVLNMELGGKTAGSQYDQLVVSGKATLNGTLNISAINGFKPTVGDIYTLVSAGSFSGSFAKVNVTGFSAKIDKSSNGITLTVTSSARQLLNISTRMEVLGGDKALISGFIITGSQDKKVLIRGLGPSLPVSGQLADPTLELFASNGASIATNDNWKQTQEQEIRATTIPPSKDLEAAMIRTLAPGKYTAILRGKNDGTGVGQAEVYDLAQTSASQLANISTRGFVDTGSNVMIGGVIIGGGSTGSMAKVLVRAIGPSLTKQGVTGALQDPTLELRDANAQLVAQNDNWKTNQEQAIRDTTVPPTDDRESAIVKTLTAGNYTAIVRGKNNTAGVGLVELYNLQ